MRIVLDPNVLVSAAVASGVSAELLDRWLTDRPFELVVCPMLIVELRDVLERPKFRRWITAEEVAVFVDRLAGEAESWDDPAEVPSVTVDPKDDYLVALHRSCQADSAQCHHAVFVPRTRAPSHAPPSALPTLRRAVENGS